MNLTDQVIVEAILTERPPRDFSLDNLKAEAKARGLISKFDQHLFLVRESAGNTSGPHRVDVLKTRFMSGEISRDTLVHVKAAKGWLPLAKVFRCSMWREGSAASAAEAPAKAPIQPAPNSASPSVEEAAKPIESDPIPTPKRENILEARSEGSEIEQIEAEGKANGIGRLHFLAGTFMAVSCAVAPPLLIELAVSLSWSLAGIFTIMMTTFTYYRLTNIGYQPGLVGLLFIPGANLWLLWKCICFPEASQSTGRLDASGRIASGLFLMLCTIAILLILTYFGLNFF